MPAPVISSTDLVSRFPEFSGAPSTLITAVIEEAVTSTPYEVWGVRYAQGVLYLAAHLLSLSPLARGGKTDCCDKGGGSRYLYERKRLARSLGVGFIVAGEAVTGDDFAGAIVPGY